MSTPAPATRRRRVRKRILIPLIVLGLVLVPISLGRWLPGRPEGVMLILLYAAYMVLWRWGSAM